MAVGEEKYVLSSTVWHQNRNANSQTAQEPISHTEKTKCLDSTAAAKAWTLEQYASQYEYTRRTDIEAGAWRRLFRAFPSGQAKPLDSELRHGRRDAIARVRLVSQKAGTRYAIRGKHCAAQSPLQGIDALKCPAQQSKHTKYPQVLRYSHAACNASYCHLRTLIGLVLRIALLATVTADFLDVALFGPVTKQAGEVLAIVPMGVDAANLIVLLAVPLLGGGVAAALGAVLLVVADDGHCGSSLGIL
ncbi:hypothetical protein DOTSEDRAFT_37170 [Dothistroma septosporum NZE10]|uniref:Uncharacterized protein n=1 Tax=Dothistroma septosporum (strain NZE10 / CBS 128990) TaxID=675120 RepID=N1PGW1_DOTSN|nr:hypothetical protein DOTSEDRAFT_37170 [Dothistroma septosporum NZE10]